MVNGRRPVGTPSSPGWRQHRRKPPRATDIDDKMARIAVGRREVWPAGEVEASQRQDAHRPAVPAHDPAHTVMK
jgi:hypothetical protein